MILSIHPGLATNSRMGALVRGEQSSNLTACIVLVAAGVAATTATLFLDFRLRIPGHAVLRAVFPMALGLALAPRRRGGMVMGASALATAMAFKAGAGFSLGTGALTSLLLVGPCLDLALRRARTGWRVYVAFAVAGLSCNLVALTIRAASKFGGFDHAAARPLAAWWMQAAGTYALCGVLAGLASAVTWFRFSSNHQTTDHGRHGFTLAEVLVVIAVIGTLLALLLPAVQVSREAARRTQCANNLKQLCLAGNSYHASRTQFPPGLDQFQVRWSPQYRGTSLFTFLLPYVEQSSVLDRWDYDAPLNNTRGGANALSATVLPILLCPSDRILENPVRVAGRYFGMTSYGGNGGARSHHPSGATCDGIFHTTGPASEPRPDQRPVTISMILDGTSQTILLGERNHHDPRLETFAQAAWVESIKYVGKWAAIGGRRRIGDISMSAFAPINYQLPFDFSSRHQADPPVTNLVDFQVRHDRRVCAFGSNHPNGANFAFADGSVRFLDQSLPLPILRALCTRNGHEVGANRDGWAVE